MSTTQLSETLEIKTNKLITNKLIRLNKFKTNNTNKVNTTDYKLVEGQNDCILVDKLLTDYEALIDQNYKLWFAKRFYRLSFQQIHQAASEARQDDKTGCPKRLFTHIIKRMYEQQIAGV